MRDAYWSVDGCSRVQEPIGMMYFIQNSIELYGVPHSFGLETLRHSNIVQVGGLTNQLSKYRCAHHLNY